MESLAAHILDLAWLPAAFVLLGAALATLLVRRLRLPAAFWLPLVFGGTSLLSYVLFYVWFLDASVGRQASTWVLIVAALAFAWQCTDRTVRHLLADRDVWLPGLLMVLVLTGYVCLLAWPQVSANYRFRLGLPPEDNNAPRVLADRIDWRLYQHGPPPPIMDHGYRSSDRPPLQTGVALALRPWQVSYTSWSYQIIGLTCQLGWIPALYALGRVIGLTRRQLAVTLLACVCSGFFFLNSIYVWPKLFAASLFLTALALMLFLIRLAHHTPDREVPRSASVVLTIATLIMLALLAHGGPFFSLIALPILLLPLRPWPRVRVRDVLIGCALGAILLAPWLAYQRFYDPPGDRLWKFHFAGLHDDVLDARPFLQTLRDEYAKLTLGQYLAGRWANVQEQFLVFGKAPPAGPVYLMQWQQFIHNLPALDFLLIGFLAWLVPRFSSRSRTERAPPPQRTNVPSRSRDGGAPFLRSLTVYAFAALIIWLVLLLAPHSALLHHGSYATLALLFLCASAWLATLPAAVVISVLTLHMLLFAWFWAAWPNQPPPAPQQGNPLYLVIAALCLIAFAASLRLIPESVVGAADEATDDYESHRTYSKSTGSRLMPLDGGAM